MKLGQLRVLLVITFVLAWATSTQAAPKIVFGTVRDSNQHDIWVMEPDGSSPTRLTTSLAYDDQPKWSPDNSKIVFMSGRDGNFEIYTMNPDGSAQTRITNNPLGDGFPAWSPDGSRIAFVRGNLSNPSTFEIWVMNANGSNEVRLTNDSVIDGTPSWSPDGTKIVFMSGGSSVFDPNAFEIYSINPDGTNRTRLTNNTIADGQPSYSPDGTRILFAAGNAMDPDGIEILVMNADGSNRAQLTSNRVTDGFPAWSFDGTTIVFAAGSVNNENSVELFVMSSDGTNRTKITTNSNVDWFPDYQRIATTPSTVQLGNPTFTTNEGSGAAQLTVTRSGNLTGIATVVFETSDTAGSNSCSAGGTVASSRCDYQTTIKTLTFLPGESSKTVFVLIVDDSYDEENEAFGANVRSLVGSGASLGLSTAAVSIIDNDSATTANPIDNATFFVRQHYLDFLNREPDAAGLAFWVDQITSCGSDTVCVEIRRINVSAAFFLAIEFQETGYFVYRTYEVAHNAPGIPVQVRYAEFMQDIQRVGEGIIVNVGDWQNQLEFNKQTYMLEFVLRQRFRQEHPTSLTPAQFVDGLFANVGVTPTPAERTAAINEFGGAATTADNFARARALRLIVDNATVRQQELNKAFVLMQYFGYLRRNPFDPPEPTLDFQGYNFWLGKLNQFNGNFVNAEMVKAFIISGEYRARFGPP